MPSSEFEDSTATSRPRRANAPAPPSAENQLDIEPKAPPQYVRGLSKRERVDMVLHELNEKHRWSIKDLIYHMVTEEPTKKYGMTCSARAKALSDAIYQREEVVQRLAKASEDVWTVGNTALSARIRNELRAVGKPGVGLGTFDPEADITTLEIPTLAKRIQNAAPELWKLLVALMEQQHASGRDTSTEYQGSIIMICSILAHARAPNTCTNLPMLLGLHLHSMGVKRRSLNLLAGLGVTSSYWAINNKRRTRKSTVPFRILPLSIRNLSNAV
jgi:hypothetical protein